MTNFLKDHLYYTEAKSDGNAVIANSYIIMENLYPKIEKVLSTPQGDRQFKLLVGEFMDRNQSKLYTVGPVYMIPFTEKEKLRYYELFNTDGKEIQGWVKDILKHLGSNSEFKYLTNNPVFFILYCCIKYYFSSKNEKGLNTALAIYALAVYPSVYSLYYKYQPNEGVMQYTVDHLTNKFMLKKSGNLFNMLFDSINNTFKKYSTNDPERGYVSLNRASDKEVIRWVQRIHNDQKSLMKNITDNYMINYRKGLRVSGNLESQDGMVIDPDKENDTSIVDSVTNKVIIPILNNGVNLKIVSQAHDLAQISLADCRYYIGKILTSDKSDEIRTFVQSILFKFLYDYRYTREDINSSKYLVWCAQLFRQTNSKNENIKVIKDTLDKWASDVGVYTKFKREASRINYKKAIFFYFAICIQYYNNN